MEVDVVYEPREECQGRYLREMVSMDGSMDVECFQSQ